MIYFVHGPDRFLARQATLAIGAEIDPEGANTSWIDGREATIERLISEAAAVSLFSTPRVVIVSDFLSRPARGGNRNHGDSAPDDRSAPENPAVKTLLGAIPEQNCLILFEPEMAAPHAAIRSASSAVTIVAGAPPRGADLISWIVEAANAAGSSIARHTAQALAEALFPQTWDRKPANPRFDRPPDMALLSQEIEKLAVAAYPDPIAGNDIADHSASGPDQRVFRFLDAAVAGDVSTAVNELERLSAAGEEPAMILAQLFGQVELTTIGALSANRNADTVAKDLGSVTPARMSAVIASAKRCRMPAEARVLAAVTIDRNLKSGRIRRPESALHDTVLTMATTGSTEERGQSR